VTQHLDVDALADVLAGARNAHLDTCETCRTRLAELSHALPQVSGALAALPDPAVPPGLERRLSAALAEARRPTQADVLPLTRRRTRWLPALGAVAAAAVLVTGGVLVAQGDGSHGSTSSTAAGPTYAVNATGTDYTGTTASLAAALPGLLSGRAPSAPAEDRAATPAPVVGQATKGAEMGPLSAPGGDPLAELRTTAGLARCLASLTDPTDSGLPLALDYASFNGRPALVVVLPSAKAGKVDVLVVPPGCAQADGQLLYFTRLPKP